MADRLSALDASFLYVEEPFVPMHVGSVAILRRRDLDYARVLALVARRLSYLPRYRQYVEFVPGHLARPVWVDDADFDVSYHVRRSALPAPGSDAQLFELVARLLARPLDRDRPLWELYVVEGVDGDGVALVTKTHQSLVNGTETIDLAQLILDDEPAGGVGDGGDEAEAWRGAARPGRVRLLLDAVTDSLRGPGEVVENVRNAAQDLSSTAGRVLDVAGGVATTVRSLVRPAPQGPLNAPVSGGRVFAGVSAELADLRTIRQRHGGTVNDVVFAVMAGALRQWLLSRGEPLEQTATVRALVPLAVRGPDSVGFSSVGLLDNRVDPCLVDLPVGEPHPVLRLQHITHAMAEEVRARRSVAARAMARVSGFAPATMHSLAARAASSLSGRMFNVVIANSPGPQHPLFAGRARLERIYPVLPLSRDQALAVGVASYDGGVYFGLNGDRKALSDIPVLAGTISEAIEELKGTDW
ncbi:wax ester/triacylglycerol synthase family O-acyltransferase [Saccharomonospora piscinae]|uniref:WS/DGAT/MGAT family O-acyltransferase n=1 Tax=Saccharomonospora piscinae TaxID=687388 RepID=UPI001106C750|nr:wax ester/triacylglycerol synthase family O-acyltransferase [Saccharomonospora piscinae]TLW91916.1 wax ester/triacylglycerol synthase family O-acyltransferase [Saccharomonospora piscinae]